MFNNFKISNWIFESDKINKINFFALLAGFFLLFFALLFGAPVLFQAPSVVRIEQGSSLRKVTLLLKQEHIIRSKIAFEVFMIIYGGEKHIIPADYYFESKLPVYEVARRISKGEHHMAPVTVTIPEGFDIAHISVTFASKLINFDQSKFMDIAKDKEGYLFPDTYFFLTTDDENDVLKSMSENFKKKIVSINSAIISSGKSEREIIIMASIIEREARGDADRKVISGILWKRLALDIPLQVDAAPETYKTKGLPKNPISNPGMQALKAAISPENSSYLYYLHDKDGNIHYARTFIEHRQNILKYLSKT